MHAASPQFQALVNAATSETPSSFSLADSVSVKGELGPADYEHTPNTITDTTLAQPNTARSTLSDSMVYASSATNTYMGANTTPDRLLDRADRTARGPQMAVVAMRRKRFEEEQAQNMRPGKRMKVTPMKHKIEKGETPRSERRSVVSFALLLFCVSLYKT